MRQYAMAESRNNIHPYNKYRQKKETDKRQLDLAQGPQHGHGLYALPSWAAWGLERGMPDRRTHHHPGAAFPFRTADDEDRNDKNEQANGE